MALFVWNTVYHVTSLELLDATLLALELAGTGNAITKNASRRCRT
jgi:hypothetical protein